MSDTLTLHNIMVSLSPKMLSALEIADFFLFFLPAVLHVHEFSLILRLRGGREKWPGYEANERDIGV